MQQTADEDLIRALAAGADDALALLVRRHEAALTGWFARHLPSREDAEEAAQDVFVKLRSGARTFNGTGPFGPWFRAIARNVLRDRLRVAPRILAVPLREEAPAAPARAPATGEVREAIAALPRPYRAALALKYLAGLSYREAAAELSITERGFESRLARAKEKLRAELARRGRRLDGLR